MPEIHTCLWNDVTEFHFVDSDFDILRELPDVHLKMHENAEQFLAAAESAEVVLTWDFPEDWYASCPNLSLIMTPAAGTDWVAPDPSGRVAISHGSYHGELLVESLIEALLFMNRHMWSMIDNFQHRSWDRNLQTGTTALAEQTVLIVGYGNIGQICGRVLRRGFGCRVIGVRREISGVDAEGVEVFPMQDLDQLLPEADHVVLLLPGIPETERFMNAERLRRCKPGAYVYNFGRGNVLTTDDLLAGFVHLGGAYLDVTDPEPLPSDSPLWYLPNIMITPHSSCIFNSYRRRFLEEAKAHLLNRDAPDSHP